MIIYKCDRCGKKIDSAENVKRIYLYGDDDPALSLLKNMDLCPKCYTKIHDYIDDFVTYTDEE